MERANVTINTTSKQDEFGLVYSCDEKLTDGSVENIEGRVKFTGHDKDGTRYGHTSGVIPFPFELSNGNVNGKKYQVTFKGGDPRPKF